MNGGTASSEFLHNMQETLNKVDHIVVRLQEMQSTIAVGRPRDCEVKPSGAGDWKQWSAPAQILHEAISDILLVAKRLASGEDVLRKSAEPETVVDVEDAPKQQQEQAKLVTDQDDRPVEQLLVVEAVRSTRKYAVKKRWRLSASRSDKAVLFPNLTFAPQASSPPANKPSSRSSNAVSLPLLIDKLPSKRKPAEDTSRAPLAKCSSRQQLPSPPSHFSRRSQTSRKENSLHSVEFTTGHNNMLKRAKGWMKARH